MPKIAKVVLILLFFLSVMILILRYGSAPMAQILGIHDRTGLRVESDPVAHLTIDQQPVGDTPYQSESYTVGDHFVQLQTDPATTNGKILSWQGYIPLNSGTVTVLNRELSENQATASGEIITLQSGRGISIVSTPDGSDVTMDGKNVGKTPLLLPDVTSGEHTIILGHSNYLNRSIKAAVVDNFQLSLRVDLSISDADLTKINTEPLQSSQQVVVKSTPTGFLRVRATASVNAAEVGQVKPGDTLILLEEAPNWDRVRLSDGKEGYVSSSYVQKKT